MSSKLLSSSVRNEIKEKLALNISPSSIANLFNCSVRSVYRVKNGENIKERGRKKVYCEKK